MYIMPVVEYLEHATPEQVKLVNQFRSARSFVLDRCDAKVFITERKVSKKEHFVEVAVYDVRLGLDKYDRVASRHLAPQRLGQVVKVDTTSDLNSLSYRLFSAQVTCWFSAAEELFKIEGGNHESSKMFLA